MAPTLQCLLKRPTTKHPSTSLTRNVPGQATKMWALHSALLEVCHGSFLQGENASGIREILSLGYQYLRESFPTGLIKCFSS